MQVVCVGSLVLGVRGCRRTTLLSPAVPMMSSILMPMAQIDSLANSLRFRCCSRVFVPSCRRRSTIFLMDGQSRLSWRSLMRCSLLGRAMGLLSIRVCGELSAGISVHLPSVRRGTICGRWLNLTRRNLKRFWRIGRRRVVFPKQRRSSLLLEDLPVRMLCGPRTWMKAGTSRRIWVREGWGLSLGRIC